MAKAVTRKTKVCNRCGAENVLNASECKQCGSSKFAPRWVLAKHPVNRQVSVEITLSNPHYGKSQKRITLAKWWPGSNTSFHIPNAAQWERIEGIINQELAPVLGWKKKSEVMAEIKKVKKGEEVDFKAIIEGHPDILKKIVSSIDPKKIGSQELESILTMFGEISDALTNANAGFREAFLNIVKKLPHQKQRALEDLSILLQGWSLHTITNVAQQVRTRLQTIELFEKQIQDPKTFEIYGDNSIHRILERAMWLIDERYWLLHSNTTLRKYIGESLSKSDKKKYGKKRPDFVCGTVGDRLIILELKRPGHTLSVDDLNQLEQYLVIAEQHKNYSSYEGYLIGSKTDDELRRTLKHRSSHFKVFHYADIIDDTKKRYTEFLKTIE
jgi:ribosomal protein L40E